MANPYPETGVGSDMIKDLSDFKRKFPACCDPERVCVPVLGRPPSIRTAYPLSINEDLSHRLSVLNSKNSLTIQKMLKQGVEAAAWYLSFRFDPDCWGAYVREEALVALRDEYHRIIWRDLGKYTERDLEEDIRAVEYGLVLDYVVGHMKLHFLVDHAAAELESSDGLPRYIPYQEWQASQLAQQPTDPRQIANLEEGLANASGIRNYLNPSYGEHIAKVVEGKIDERNVQEWKSFFVGGRFSVEIANLLSRHPPGHRDFGKFLNRQASVGATNYIRVKYSFNQEKFEAGLNEIALRLGGESQKDEAFKHLNSSSLNLPIYLAA